MYYKIKNNVLFRQYRGYGYITDNSEFGYRFMNDARHFPGEKYVSESGAIMLAALSKTPRHIDDIVAELLQIFVGVEADTLKQDTVDFFQHFVEDGYLVCGETFDICQRQEHIKESDRPKDEAEKTDIQTENCSKELFSPNDFLRSIHIEIASTCNERCVHCYIPPEYKNKTMDSELFYSILEQGRRINIVHVILSGGEPLLHRDIKSFLAKCRELDLSVNPSHGVTRLNKLSLAKPAPYQPNLPVMYSSVFWCSGWEKSFPVPPNSISSPSRKNAV